MTCLKVSAERLLERIAALASIGAIEDGGNCRVALTDADRAGRDQVVQWMRDLGMQVSIDPIGNVVALKPGWADGPPVMIGSHIDTVATGGRYDGNLGVLAGLEVAAALLAEEVAHERSLAVAFFTNEEGVRFAPDMMGSLVYAGGLPLTTALDCIGTDGARLGDELARIGYAGTAPLGIHRPCAFLELHIEQGPVLEAEGKTIGVVDSVQGISWTAYDIKGVSNHAGTTPMHLRRDAGYVAAELICFVRALARRCGGSQVSTVGRVVLEPNLVNVIARRAHLTVDLRNTEANVLRRAEKEVASFVIELAERERVDIASTPLVRLDPVCFDRDLVARVEATAGALGYSSRRMPSGAGHDAQMMARICPTAMIFVPSVAGISHNVREFSRPEHIEAGLQVLADLTLELLNK